MSICWNGHLRAPKSLNFLQVLFPRPDIAPRGLIGQKVIMSENAGMRMITVLDKHVGKRALRPNDEKLSRDGAPYLRNQQDESRQLDHRCRDIPRSFSVFFYWTESPVGSHVAVSMSVS